LIQEVSMKILVAFACLTAFAGSAFAQNTPSVQVSPLGPTSALLSLTAEGRSNRVPDLAVFSSGVVTNGVTAAEALGANSRQMDRVVAALKRSGIADRDIQTSAISLSPRWNNPEVEAQRIARETRQPYVPPTEPPRIIGYEARNSVQVRVRRLGEMGKIIDTLVAAGANEVNGPSFTLDDQKTAMDEARIEAVAVGRERAELYAKAAGMRVVRLLSMSEGGGYYPVQQIFVSGMRAERGGAPPPPPPPAPVSPGELTLGTSLSMQFELGRF
jgi:uncharacterized protein YggE